MTTDNIKTIDITPTWEQILPALLAVLTEGTTREGREHATQELVRMAKAADAYAARIKQDEEDNTLRAAREKEWQEDLAKERELKEARNAASLYCNLTLSKATREEALGIVRRYEAKHGVTIIGNVNGGPSPCASSFDVV